MRGLDLNQRPSGYEPDELPGCSTPRDENTLDVNSLQIEKPFQDERFLKPEGSSSASGQRSTFSIDCLYGGRHRRLGKPQVFSGPFPGKFLEFGCVVQAQLVLNFFAVGFDGLFAKVKLVGNLACAV